MYFDNRSKVRKFQGYRSKVKVTGFFTVARYGKKFVCTITHEPLHSAWWNFARTCTTTTSWILMNFKVIVKGQGHMGFCAFLCVHDTAATRGQYLALSKAWRSCCMYISLCWIQSCRRLVPRRLAWVSLHFAKLSPSPSILAVLYSSANNWTHSDNGASRMDTSCCWNMTKYAEHYASIRPQKIMCFRL